MNEMLLQNQGEESTRFPPIGKGIGVSQSMVNLSSETIQAKGIDLKKIKQATKKPFKNEIIVEDHKEKDGEDKK